jgi:flagellar protein FlbD
MILLTRLNGDEIYLNPDLIERIEATHDTIVSLVDGKKYVAVEEPHELINRIVAFRAAVLVAAEAEAHEHSARPSGGERKGATSSFGAVTPPRPLRLIDDHLPSE